MDARSSTPENLSEELQRALSNGYGSMARSEWEVAREQFDSVARPDGPAEAWEGLAEAAWWLQDTTTLFEARLEAHRRYRERGETVPAARVAVSIGNDYLDFRGESAIASGWYGRARRLLEGFAILPEHAWLRAFEARLALMANSEVGTSLELLEEAFELARQADCYEVEVLALALQGLAKVVEGEVTSGMAELDEANAAAFAGDVGSPYAVGLACCYLISACEQVRDFDRVAQWCGRLRDFSRRERFAVFLTTCRLQYATVLISRGDYGEAEAELQAAAEDLTTARPFMLSAAWARMGEMRRRQGRLDEARGLFEKSSPHPIALLGQATMALERGEPSLAEERVNRYLRRLPPDSRLRRAPGLELLARIEAANGQPVKADAVLAELQEATELSGTTAAQAAALAARAAVAAGKGDPVEALDGVAKAGDLYEQSGLPYEAASCRLQMARMLQVRGEQASAERAVADVLSMSTSLGASGLAREAKKLEESLLEPSSQETEPQTLSKRERQVLSLVADGLSNREIAEELGISHHTVNRHVTNVRDKLAAPTRAAAVAEAARQGLL